MRDAFSLLRGEMSKILPGVYVWPSFLRGIFHRGEGANFFHTDEKDDIFFLEPSLGVTGGKPDIMKTCEVGLCKLAIFLFREKRKIT
jgi:hypothetical protein